MAFFRYQSYLIVTWSYHIPFTSVSMGVQRGALSLIYVLVIDVIHSSTTLTRRLFFLLRVSSFEEPRRVLVQVQEVFRFMTQRKTTESTMTHLQIAVNKEKSTTVEQHNPGHPSQTPVRERRVELKKMQVIIASSTDMITLTYNPSHLELSKYKSVYNIEKNNE